MHHKTQTQTPLKPTPNAFLEGIQKTPEMRLYSRYEHGNLPVRVFRTDEGSTRYEVTHRTDMTASGTRTEVFTSARKMIASFYGHDVHMPFDRYFRLGRYRREGRHSGSADLLTLLDTNSGSSKKTNVVIHGKGVKSPLKTPMGVSPTVRGKVKVVKTSSEGVKEPADPVLEEFYATLEADMKPLDAFIEPTEEMKAAFDKVIDLELDRLMGRVGMDLGEESGRSGCDYKADEVRKLLWNGFAGKMLSQGYDPEDVLQEVYKGLLVRNNGRCPWDGRKSTFGHYVYMVIDGVLTNYHRKQKRRSDRYAVSLSMKNKDGEDLADIGQFGSCQVWGGSELGDMLALEGLQRYLEILPMGGPEAQLGRSILPLVASGHQRSEIVRETGKKPSLVSRALAWLRRQTALWATESGLGCQVPTKYLVTP